MNRLIRIASVVLAAVMLSFGLSACQATLGGQHRSANNAFGGSITLTDRDIFGRTAYGRDIVRIDGDRYYVERDRFGDCRSGWRMVQNRGWVCQDRRVYDEVPLRRVRDGNYEVRCEVQVDRDGDRVHREVFYARSDEDCRRQGRQIGRDVADDDRRDRNRETSRTRDRDDNRNGNDRRSNAPEYKLEKSNFSNGTENDVCRLRVKGNVVATKTVPSGTTDVEAYCNTWQAGEARSRGLVR